MKKIIRTILLTLMICFIYIVIKNEYARLLLANANFGMEALITESKKNPKEVNLWIGSSMFRMGIDSNSLYNQLGENEFILAYNGNQPYLEFYEIEYLLNSGVEINQIYLDMYVYAAASEPALGDLRLLLQTDTDFKNKVWKELHQTGKVGFKDFWEMYVGANNDVIFAWPFYYPLVNQASFQGGNLRTVGGMTTDSLNNIDKPTVSETVINSKQMDYLIKMIKLCQNNNIILKFVETPKYYEISQDNIYLKIINEYINLLDEYHIEYYLSNYTYEALIKYTQKEPNCEKNHIVLFNSKEPAFFSDYIHMSSDGKVKYTINLTKLINGFQ